MPSAIELTLSQLQHAFETMSDNISTITLKEALFVPQGGYRSILGTIKHAAGWSHVYRSYAFDASPRHWIQLDWPRGLRETIAKEKAYVDEVITWFNQAHHLWIAALTPLSDAEL